MSDAKKLAEEITAGRQHGQSDEDYSSICMDAVVPIARAYLELCDAWVTCPACLETWTKRDGVEVHKHMSNVMKENAALRARVKALEGALRIYANRKHWVKSKTGGHDWFDDGEDDPAKWDGWLIAEDALGGEVDDE
jgi:hypothetical protein